jgi:hypothetical protein
MTDSEDVSISDSNRKNLHRGLANQTGENNCFLNVTIQALWHLGPFRVELQRLVANPPKYGKLLPALCRLFYDYEFADLSVLPPTELREVLFSISDRFELGSIADSNEALEVILEQLHNEHEHVCTFGNEPNSNLSTKCISHHVFGSVMLEQTICDVCQTRSEPTMINNFIHNVYATELLETLKNEISHQTPPDIESKDDIDENIYDIEFAKLLKTCLRVQPKGCPSIDDYDKNSVKKNINLNPSHITSRPTCLGKGEVTSFCLEPPLGLALSISWPNDHEVADNIQDFLALISYTLNLNDIFEFSKNQSGTKTDESTYVFRGLVCYYGRHYVSIFQEYSPGIN